MDILSSYIENWDSHVVVKLSSFISAKEQVIVKHSANFFADTEVTAEKLQAYWSRLFGSKKKQDDKLKFSSDKSAVDWDSLVDLINERKLLNLSRKRRAFHTNLHLQEDARITELIESSVQPRDQVDRLFMGVDDELNIPKLTSAVTNWMENAHHVKELHKQDLLYYRIMDFTTSDSSAGVYSILKDKYSLAKHYYCSFQNDIGKAMEDGCDGVKGYASSVFKKKKKSLRKCIKKAKEARRSYQHKLKEQKYCLRTMALFKNIDLLDEDMNENEYTMCFIYPLLHNLFKYSKQDIVIRWGEAKLQSKKAEEHSALEDNHRRSPGPSIDFIFRTKCRGKIELAVGEISGAPTAQSQEHYLGDRNKIAKNLKSMLKYILGLKPGFDEERASKVQVYGVHIYQLQVRVYRLMYHRGHYIFMQVDSYMIPTLPIAFQDQLPHFLSHMWKLKNYLTESLNSVVRYISNPSEEIHTTTTSTLSSPYVSPQKRQKV